MRILLASVNCQKADIRTNLETHERVIREAADAQCDIAVFPEMSLTGYLDPETHSESLLNLNSGQLTDLIAYGEQASVDLLFGIVERGEDSKAYITQVHASAGTIMGSYRKRHLADNEGAFTAGSDSYIGRSAGETFGVAVCADYEVSDEFVAASSSGATVVFHASAPGLYGDRKIDDKGWQRGFDWWRNSTVDRHSRRAKELGVYIAMCTQAGPTVDEDFPGWAALFGPDGEIISELPDWKPGTLVVEI